MADKVARFEGRMEVRSGKETEFARWQNRYREVVASYPGLITSEILAPSVGNASWTTSLTFESDAALVQWLKSPERAELLKEAEPLAVCGMTSRFSEDEGSSLGVTEAFFTRVRPDCLEALQIWQTRAHLAQAEFPGYLGMVFQPPMPGQDQCTTLIRFDTSENLEAWLASPERRELLDELEEIIEEFRQWRLTSSFPGWVPAAPEDSEPPANWKVTMLVVAGLFPIVMLQLHYMTPWLSANLPHSPGTLLANIISASLISYLTMPICIRLFSWWLYPKKGDAARVNVLGFLAVLAIYGLEVLLLWNF